MGVKKFSRAVLPLLAAALFAGYPVSAIASPESNPAAVESAAQDGSGKRDNNQDVHHHGVTLGVPAEFRGNQGVWIDRVVTTMVDEKGSRVPMLTEVFLSNDHKVFKVDTATVGGKTVTAVSQGNT